VPRVLAREPARSTAALVVTLAACAWLGAARTGLADDHQSTTDAAGASRTAGTTAEGSPAATEHERAAQSGPKGEAKPGEVYASLMPALTEITAEDVDAYLTTQTAFLEQGLRLQRTDDGVTANGPAMALLQEKGLTPERMRELGYAISLAMATLTKGPDQIEAELAQAEAQFERMKDTAPPEMAALYDKQLNAAVGMIAVMRSQPPGNLALVEARREEVAALLTRMQPMGMRSP
jgi:hypothetical protein